MGSCATGTCAPDCLFCERLRRDFPPVKRCAARDDAGDRCILVAGHPTWIPHRNKGKKAEKKSAAA